MPVSCSIKNCKNTKRKKNLEITFHRFPFKNKKIMEYWIAAIGRNNWIPYSDARICSLHFVNNDYYNNIKSNQKRYLKPDVIPTQHVHTNILQVFQQDTVNKINKHNPNNDTTPEEDLTNQQTENHETTAISKCSNCSNYNNVLLENKKLRKIIENIKILQEERLNQRAEMFHIVMHNNEAVLKQKLEVVGKKIKP